MSDPQTEDPRDSGRLDLRTRRLVLVSALVLALSVVGIVAILASRQEDPLAESKPPTPSPSTPIARITLRPTAQGPRDARGLAEVVKRDGRYELRLIAKDLRRTRDDTSYRVFFANRGGEKTIGRTSTDKRGTLIGESRIDVKDLTTFLTLRVALEAPVGSETVLRGRLPR